MFSYNAAPKALAVACLKKLSVRYHCAFVSGEKGDATIRLGDARMSFRITPAGTFECVGRASRKPMNIVEFGTLVRSAALELDHRPREGLFE